MKGREWSSLNLRAEHISINKTFLSAPKLQGIDRKNKKIKLDKEIQTDKELKHHGSANFVNQAALKQMKKNMFPLAPLI